MSHTSREKQEEEMLARWKKDYGDDEDFLVFPPNVVSFQVCLDDDEVVCFIATPTEYFELTGYAYDQHFEIKGLDEEVWFETMEGVWETEVYDTIQEAAEELEALGLKRNPRIPSPFGDSDEDTDSSDEEDEEPIDIESGDFSG